MPGINFLPFFFFFISVICPSQQLKDPAFKSYLVPKFLHNVIFSITLTPASFAVQEKGGISLAFGGWPSSVRLSCFPALQSVGLGFIRAGGADLCSYYWGVSASSCHSLTSGQAAAKPLLLDPWAPTGPRVKRRNAKLFRKLKIPI